MAERIPFVRRAQHADDEAKAKSHPDATRLGDFRFEGSRGHPQVRGIRWAQDRADPHARERAMDFARRIRDGVTPDEAVAEVRDVLDSIGDTCPECLPAS
jgi:hypothetical protein